MNFTQPQQARCDDRKILTKGPNPQDWIASALPCGWAFYGFHFFVNWKVNPPTLGSEVWLTRLIHFSGGENPQTVTEASILSMFKASADLSTFESLARFCQEYRQVVRMILLPEISAAALNDQSPVWSIVNNADGSLVVSKLSLIWLKAEIQKNSGGPVWVGSKGLTYGTSAVECMLSKTDSLYPGDVDAVIVDHKNVARCIIEYKKHTIDDAIGNHLVNKYYPKPDGRKYQRLQLLVSHYRTYKPVPFMVLYYSTRTPTIRLQELGTMLPNKVEISRDSGDLDISGLTHNEIANRVVAWLGITK